jgi:spore germination cell wall hydrolase CwlJ-like protein
MKNILTEVLWVSFMVIMGAAFYAAYKIATQDTVTYTSVYVEPVVLDRLEARPIPPAKYYLNPDEIQLNEREFLCLARNIYYEAGVEEYIGKIAVAQITWNRVRHGRWGKSVCKVVHAPYQFSWTRQNKAAPKGPLWEESLQAARDFLNGTRVAGLQRSKYYHATWIKDPHWTQKLEVVAVIGQHRFYRTPQ